MVDGWSGHPEVGRGKRRGWARERTACSETGTPAWGSDRRFTETIMATFGSPGGTRQLRHGSRNAVSSWASITRKVVILRIDLPHVAPGETGRVGLPDQFSGAAGGKPSLQPNGYGSPQRMLRQVKAGGPAACKPCRLVIQPGQGAHPPCDLAAQGWPAVVQRSTVNAYN